MAELFQPALNISGFLVQPFSSRSVKQTLSLIDMIANGDDMIWRDVNGNLVDTTPIQFRKYKSTITGEDCGPPAVDGMWPGQIVTVDCIVWLAIAGSPNRPAVESRSENGWTMYRPQLEMMVKGDISVQTDDWGAVTSWSLSLEEL